jgi:solute:Na+ symporter, SSS family
MQQFLPPFMLGLVFVGAIAAIHSTAAPYLGTGGSILLRDVYWRYIKKQEASHAEQIWVNRILATVLTIAALAVGLTSKAALVILGALATAFGFVMYIFQLGVLWGFRFPSMGAVLGTLAGMVAVYSNLCHLAEPLSMHSAFWGTFTGLVVAYICRAVGMKDDEETIKRQQEVRNFLDDIDAPSEKGQQWRKYHETCCHYLVFLCYRTCLYSRQHMLFICRIHTTVVMADCMVDSGHYHDVGFYFQGGNVHHQCDPD